MASCVWVPRESRLTITQCPMAYSLTLGIDATSPRARIQTSLTDASKSRRAVRINGALWFAANISISKISRWTGADDRAILGGTLGTIPTYSTRIYILLILY